MPRGNDSEAALHELADKFGEGVGNAEDLIDATLAANTQELRRAQALPIDEEKTKEALENIDKYSGPDGEEVVSIAVRGAATSPRRYAVIVYRTEEGRDLVAALDDDNKPVVPGSSSKPKAKSSRKGDASSGSGSSDTSS